MSKNTTSDLHVFVQPFDIDQIGYHSSASIGVEVHGYWSDVITVYVRRECDWTKDPEERTPNWKIEITHSSGGRDTAEVADDVLANDYFAAGLMTASQIARNIRHEAARLEANYQRARVDAKAEAEAEAAAKAAAAAADPAMGEEQAKAMVEKLAAAARYAVSDRAYRCGYWDAHIVVFARGSEHPTRRITARKGRDNTVRFYDSGSLISRAQAKVALTGQSIRSHLNAPQA